jgi:hypothetical protein
MLKLKLVVPLLSLVLLGGAAAQGARTVYFVFKLATTLPVTLQAAPECVAEREGWRTSTAALEETSVLRLLETYSFVSTRTAEALRQDIEAYAQEHTFRGTDLGTGEGADLPNTIPGREFRYDDAPGFRYLVRVYERPEGAEARSVLCITVIGPPATDQR